MLACRFIIFYFVWTKILVFSRPIGLDGNSTTVIDSNRTNLDLLGEILVLENEKATEKKGNTIDPTKFITLRENDWRDAHEGRMIIWSHESQYHPDYGKTYSTKRKKYTQRQSISSQITSFCILGSVIGFILYTYFSHVLMMRKLNREMEASRLRELVHRSALIMAGSAQQNDQNFAERRRSLINMFKAFKL